MQSSLSTECKPFCTVVKLKFSNGNHQKSRALRICFGLAEGFVEPDREEKVDRDICKYCAG